MTAIHRLVKRGIWRLRHTARRCHFNLAGLGPALSETLLMKERERLVVIDDYFPRLDTGFRIAEFNSILKHFDNAVIYSTNDDRRVFSQYAAVYPQFARRVRRFNGLVGVRGSAVYIVFLSNTFTHLKRLEAAHLPFVFELY